MTCVKKTGFFCFNQGGLGVWKKKSREKGQRVGGGGEKDAGGRKKKKGGGGGGAKKKLFPLKRTWRKRRGPVGGGEKKGRPKRIRKKSPRGRFFWWGNGGVETGWTTKKKVFFGAKNCPSWQRKNGENWENKEAGEIVGGLRGKKKMTPIGGKGEKFQGVGKKKKMIKNQRPFQKRPPFSLEKHCPPQRTFCSFKKGTGVGKTGFPKPQKWGGAPP